MATNLINKRIIFKLSDPWDLGEKLGWQALEATILNVKHESGAPALIAISLTHPFHYQNTCCEFFIASPRHEGIDFAQLDKRETVFCGLTRVSPEQMATGNPFDLNYWRGGVGLIGEIQLR